MNEARKLATQVVKQARYNVRVKIGRTNGRPVLHVIRPQTRDNKVRAASVTFPADESFWLAHEWNRLNRAPREATDTELVVGHLHKAEEAFERLGEAATEASEGVTALAHVLTDDTEELSTP